MSKVTLQEPRNIVSPREGKQWDTKAPVRPGDETFDEMLCEVVDTVKRTEQNSWPSEFLARNNPTSLEGSVPRLIAEKLNLRGTYAARNLAMAVSMDKPWHLGEFIADKLLSEGVTYKNHKPGTIQFCDKEDSYMAFMTDLQNATSNALDRVFDVKYFWQEPRPEDYLGVHGSIFCVDSMSAPGHWRYGAGHGAAAGATVEVILRHFNVTADQAQEVIHAGWVFSHGRTMLGVHLHEDNEVGFNIGRQF